MEYLRPGTWREALEMRAAHPEAVPIHGGTDVMVDLNFDRARPGAVLDLAGLEEIAGWERVDGRLRVGAGVTYTRLIAGLARELPGLAMASRTVGSPQIRNRGTVGGNLGSSSPAGDALPPLYASGGEVELESLSGGRRLLPVSEFIVGPKRNALAEGELICAFHLPPADGPQQYSKVGPRNAMVIAVCSFALALHPGGGTVGTCIGSAGPTPLRAPEAEEFARGVIEEGGLWERRGPIEEGALRRFGELVAEAARPIDDVRGSAAYRRHALGVLARRSLAWAWGDYVRGEHAA